MTLKHLAGILACSFAAHAAQADVLYSFAETKSGPAMFGSLHLDMVFSDAAVQAGSLRLGIDNLCRDAGCIDRQTSLLSLRYWIEQDGRQRNVIDYRVGKAPQMFHDKITLDLGFLPDGVLGGIIMANNGESSFHLQGSEGLFTQLASASDQGPCGIAVPFCHGTEGMLKRVAAAEVPEPPSWLVLGAGALAAWALRRRPALRRAVLRRPARPECGPPRRNGG